MHNFLWKPCFQRRKVRLWCRVTVFFILISSDVDLRRHGALTGFRGKESDLVTAQSHWNRKGRNKSLFARAADQPAAHLSLWFLRLGEKPQLLWLYRAKGGRGLAVHVQFPSSWRLGPMEALHQAPPRAMHNAARSLLLTAGLILPVPRAGHLCSHTCLWASLGPSGSTIFR